MTEESPLDRIDLEDTAIIEAKDLPPREPRIKQAKSKAQVELLHAFTETGQRLSDAAKVLGLDPKPSCWDYSEEDLEDMVEAAIALANGEACVPEDAEVS